MVTTLDVAPLNLIQADVLVITPSIRRRRKKKKTYSVRFPGKKKQGLDCLLLLSFAFGIGSWDFTQFHLGVDGLHSINMELLCSGLGKEEIE